VSQPFASLAGLDRLVHEPARLAILTALSACSRADFLYLLRLTGLTKGNLSSHLAKLESAGFVVIDKVFSGKTPLTTVQLTASGRQAIDGHWRELGDLARSVREWEPEGA
jgi:DNA-binding MarR family transcriptional regulator